MPIKVACTCGASFAAKDEMAGKTVACPKCKKPIKIGASAPAAAPKQASASRPAPSAPASQPSLAASVFDEVGLNVHQGVRCPKCNAALPANAVLCVKCGYHLQQGTVVETDLPVGGDAHNRVAVTLLKKAEVAIEHDKEEDKKNRTQGAPWWLIFIAFAGVVGFAAMMFALPPERAFKTAGYVLIGAGIVGALYFLIRISIIGFQEKTSHGVLILCTFPFYLLYYVFTHWDELGALFLLILASAAVSGAGYGALVLGPLLSKKEGDVYHYPPPLIRQLTRDEYAQTFRLREHC